MATSARLIGRHSDRASSVVPDPLSFLANSWQATDDRWQSRMTTQPTGLVVVIVLLAQRPRRTSGPCWPAGRRAKFDGRVLTPVFAFGLQNNAAHVGEMRQVA